MYATAYATGRGGSFPQLDLPIAGCLLDDSDTEILMVRFCIEGGFVGWEIGGAGSYFGHGMALNRGA